MLRAPIRGVIPRIITIEIGNVVGIIDTMAFKVLEFRVHPNTYKFISNRNYRLAGGRFGPQYNRKILTLNWNGHLKENGEGNYQANGTLACLKAYKNRKYFPAEK